ELEAVLDGPISMTHPATLARRMLSAIIEWAASGRPLGPLRAARPPRQERGARAGGSRETRPDTGGSHNGQDPYDRRWCVRLARPRRAGGGRPEGGRLPRRRDR